MHYLFMTWTLQQAPLRLRAIGMIDDAGQLHLGVNLPREHLAELSVLQGEQPLAIDERGRPYTGNAIGALLAQETQP